MYHVGTTKRSRDSAELIYYGVAICSQEKPLESVTISDIQRITGIARTTFYRSFDSVTDVLEWKCDQYYNRFLDRCPARADEEMTLHQIARILLVYLNENPELPLYLHAQGRIRLLLDHGQRLAEDLDLDPVRVSPYSVLLTWTVPFLLMQCKSSHQLTDTPDEIWEHLVREDFLRPPL